MTMVVRFWHFLQIIERFWKVQADNPCSAMSKVRDGDILIMLTLLINYENQVHQEKGGDDEDGGGVLP